jgi:hypothetical protein
VKRFWTIDARRSFSAAQHEEVVREVAEEADLELKVREHARLVQAPSS